MIKPAFLKAQIAKSKAQHRTAPVLRRLVASAVDETAQTHYGAGYAMKCLQASHAAQGLLARLEIESRLWMGAFCAAEIFEEWGHDGWGGFWNEDHHVWLVTQFGELVDLTVAHMHKHPRVRRTDGIPMPAVWWDTLGAWPPVVRYLPDAPIRVGLRDAGDVADLSEFESKVARCFESKLSRRVDELAYEPMLENIEGMNRLTTADHRWLNRAFAFPERGIPFPPWIQDREAELLAAHRDGSQAASRLSHVPDLVADFPSSSHTAT